MTAIPLSCGHCQSQFRITQEHSGRNVRCPHCRNAVAVPADCFHQASTEASRSDGSSTHCAARFNDSLFSRWQSCLIWIPQVSSDASSQPLTAKKTARQCVRLSRGDAASGKVGLGTSATILRPRSSRSSLYVAAPEAGGLTAPTSPTVISLASRFSCTSASTGSRRRYFVNWLTIRPAAMLAQ